MTIIGNSYPYRLEVQLASIEHCKAVDRPVKVIWDWMLHRHSSKPVIISKTGGGRGIFKESHHLLFDDCSWLEVIEFLVVDADTHERYGDIQVPISRHLERTGEFSHLQLLMTEDPNDPFELNISIRLTDPTGRPFLAEPSMSCVPVTCDLCPIAKITGIQTAASSRPATQMQSPHSNQSAPIHQTTTFHRSGPTQSGTELRTSARGGEFGGADAWHCRAVRVRGVTDGFMYHVESEWRGVDERTPKVEARDGRVDFNHAFRLERAAADESTQQRLRLYREVGGRKEPLGVLAICPSQSLKARWHSLTPAAPGAPSGQQTAILLDIQPATSETADVPEFLSQKSSRLHLAATEDSARLSQYRHKGEKDCITVYSGGPRATVTCQPIDHHKSLRKPSSHFGVDKVAVTRLVNNAVSTEDVPSVPAASYIVPRFIQQPPPPPPPPPPAPPVYGILCPCALGKCQHHENQMQQGPTHAHRHILHPPSFRAF